MLRWIVGQLVRSLLTSRVATQPTAPTASAQTQRTASDDTKPNVSADYALAVLSSYDAETAVFCDRMKDVVSTHAAGFSVRTGTISGRRIAVAAVGDDWTTAARATEAIATAYHPQLVVAVGFVTGLSTDIARGDLVVARQIVGEAEQRVALDVAGESTKTIHFGTLTTVRASPVGPSERKQLGDAYSALAADRIALPVGLACGREGIPMMAVVAVTTAVGDHSSRHVAHLLSQRSLAGKAGALVGSLFRKPSTARELWQLNETNLTAGSRLAEFLTRLISA